MKNLRLSIFIVAAALALPDRSQAAEGVRYRCSITIENAATTPLAFYRAPEAPKVPAPVKSFEASRSISQKLRDNAHDYWAFMRTKAGDYFPAGVLNFNGWIVGDLHPGNFILAPLAGKMTFFIADIKDGGHGPLFADFQRLVTSTYAVNEKGLKKTAELLFDSYLKGLTGAAPEPSQIDDLLSTELAQYEANQRKYVEKQTKGNRFKKSPGKVERVPFKNSEPERYERLVDDISDIVKSNRRGSILLDIAFRPRERGGSKEMTRYWALVSVKGEKTIVEFKEIGEPATADFDRQDGAEIRYAQIRKAYWPASDNSYRIVSLDGRKFWMRPKKTDVFRVPYKMAKKSDLDFLMALSAREAFEYGRAHARQDRGGRYAAALAKNRAVLLEGLRKFTKDYLKQLKTTLLNQEDEP